jgi:hypothetical protein
MNDIDGFVLYYIMVIIVFTMNVLMVNETINGLMLPLMESKFRQFVEKKTLMEIVYYFHINGFQ